QAGVGSGRRSNAVRKHAHAIAIGAEARLGDQRRAERRRPAERQALVAGGRMTAEENAVQSRSASLFAVSSGRVFREVRNGVAPEEVRLVRNGVVDPPVVLVVVKLLDAGSDVIVVNGAGSAGVGHGEEVE